MTAVENIFHRYDYLCSYYANKITINSNSAIQKDDLIQELRIRLFTSIKTYCKKFSEWEKSGIGKPVPLKFYLQTAMINKTKDLMKEVNSNGFMLSIDSSGVNCGSDRKEISFENYNLTVGGQNLLDLFTGEEKTIMKLLFIKNFEEEKVIDKYNGRMNAKKVIKKGLEKIRTLLSSEMESVNEFHYFQLEN